MDLKDINLSKKLAIPLKIFDRLSKKDLYILEKKVPDEIEQYFDLKTFPLYLINKYNLKPGSALIPSTNTTQKDIELFLTWKLAKFLSKLDKSNTHFALMLPKHDRGIECYIRCLDIENDFLIGIPVQICEIVFTKKIITNNNYEKIVFDLAVKAKSKPVDCNGAILLMNLNSDGNVKINTNLDRYLLRDLFETVNWSYRKIIILSSSKELGDHYVTVYSDDPKEHFIGKEMNGKCGILMGRTKEDEHEIINEINNKDSFDITF